MVQVPFDKMQPAADGDNEGANLQLTISSGSQLLALTSFFPLVDHGENVPRLENEQVQAELVPQVQEQAITSHPRCRGEGNTQNEEASIMAEDSPVVEASNAMNERAQGNGLVAGIFFASEANVDDSDVDVDHFLAQMLGNNAQEDVHEDALIRFLLQDTNAEEFDVPADSLPHGTASYPFER